MPNLKGLRDDLSSRLSSLQELAAIEAQHSSRGRRARLEQHRFLFLDFLRAAEPVATKFDEIGGYAGARWALLFDELDLAPLHIRTRLLQALRSVDQRFLFKLSLSPFSAEAAVFSLPEGAMPGQDFDLINLSYARKEDGYRFARALFESVLVEQGFADTKVEDVLGVSVFDTPAEEWTDLGTAYHEGSRLQKRFRDLNDIDQTFAAYLERRHIDVSRLGEYAGDTRAADIRKVTSLVAVRSAFRSEGVGRDVPKRRSRKSPDIYSGATAVFAITEGNPRWLLGVALALTDRYALRRRRVPEPAQATELQNAAGRFLALLRTLRVPLGASQDAAGGLLQLLDPIGEFFSERAIDAPFDPEPPGTFRVDPALPDAVLDALGLALNAGAIVRVPTPEDRGLLVGLPGQKFRLSYLLAPHYYLPIRLGRSVNLAQIIAERSRIVPGQLSLGDWS
jgi:hypothetical protein